MKDFFISYNNSDSQFATWVASLLKENGKSVIIQEWDFRPGDNFVEKINESLIGSEKLIVILSNAYLKSGWCNAEWTTKMIQQIQNRNRCIIPIRIEPVELKGLLASIIHIDVVDKVEDDAKMLILEGILDSKEQKKVGRYPSYYNLEHLEIDVDYYVYEDRIEYIKTCKSKILVDGMNKIHNRITWFVDEKVELLSLTEGARIEYIDLKDTNLNYNVVFDRNFKKDQEVEFKIKAIVTNKNRHFENFFSTEIIAPLKQLHMHLNIEDKTVKKVYTQKICNSPMNRRTEEPLEHEYVSPYHWHIVDPELHFEYKIFWKLCYHLC